MSKAYILSGTLFGDEGKGSFVDYLASIKNINKNIRYNGGSQASHTVILDDGTTHKFSQLGSSMFIKENQTYLSENTIVNLFNIFTEAQTLSSKTNMNIEQVIERVFIDKSSNIVTPYHSLIDRIRELSSQYEQRGIIGTGNSEVMKVYKESGIILKAQDFLSGDYAEILSQLYFYTKDFLTKNLPYIKESDLSKLDELDLKQLIDKENRLYIKNCYQNMIKALHFNIMDGVDRFCDNNSDVILEGSQGLLLDVNYGIKPNTTFLDTTNQFGITLADKLKLEKSKIGIISAYTSRHGLGILPTYDEELSNTIVDLNQYISGWQGSPRYGWLDLVLLRYSDSINKNDEYYLSNVDRFQNLSKIKICNTYLYKGTIDNEFIETFEYTIEKGNIIIKNILKNSPRLKEFLQNTIPQYVEIKGFNNNEDSIEYLRTIEELANIKITVSSFGPTRKDKVLVHTL